MREFVVIYCCKLPRVSPIHLEKIVSIFSIHMLALAGIEIVVGLTMIGTFLAIVLLVIGSSIEKKLTETQPEKFSDDGKDAKVLVSEITPTTKKPPDLKPSLQKSEGAEQTPPKLALPVLPSSLFDSMSIVPKPPEAKPDEAKDAPEKIENDDGEPVMAILKKPNSGDKSAVSKMPNVGEGPDLPPLPGESKPADGEELERQIVEKRLQRIADKQANQKKDELGELPAFPTPPKVGGEKSALPPIPKPFLHELPQPGGEKPALPPLPKQGGDLPPIPGSASEQDEADLQTRDKDRDS